MVRLYGKNMRQKLFEHLKAVNQKEAQADEKQERRQDLNLQAVESNV